MHLLNVCLHSFPKMLDHLHYHYSDFYFWKVAYLHLVVFLEFYLVLSSGTKPYAFFILVNFLWCDSDSSHCGIVILLSSVAAL